jgi:NAD(P)-dependent dehydrogenase (short-subunit alcohol dehydrogenase family)
MQDVGSEFPPPLSVFRPEVFSGMTALVTGASRGIGRTTALAFAKFGANVVATSRTTADLEKLSDEIVWAGGRAKAVTTDIRDVDQVERLRDTAVEAFGRVDFVVNNAGGQFPARPSGISDRGWRAVIDLNLNGTWNMCSRFCPVLLEQGFGAVVNVVHTFVFERGAPLMAHSGAARAGVVNLTRSLAPYLAPRNVTINALAFANVRGGGLDSELALFGREHADIEATIERHAVQLGTEEEIAAIILFLCSPAARFISGSTIVADLGGQQRNLPFHEADDFKAF